MGKVLANKLGIALGTMNKGKRLESPKCFFRSSVILYLFIFISLNVCGQELRYAYPVLGRLSMIPFQTPDSLRHLFQQAYPLVKSSPDSAIGIYLKALSWSRSAYDNRGVSKALFGLALSYETKRDFLKVVFYGEESIRLDDLEGAINVEKYATLSQSYAMLGEHKKAIQIGQHVFPPPFSAVDSLYVASIDVSTANTYKDVGQMDSAFYYYYKALKKWPLVDSFNAEFLCELYLGLSDISFRLKEYKKSIKYLDEALLVANKCKNEAIKVGLLSAKGTNYYALGDTVNAKKEIYHGLEFGRKIKDKELIAGSAYNLANIYFSEKKYQEAKAFGEESFKAGSQTQMLSARINAHLLMGRIFFELKDYVMAAQYMEAGIKEAELKGMKPKLSEAYNAMGTVCYRLKRYKDAYIYKTKFNNLERNLRNKEVADRIARIEQQYKTVEKDKYIAEQKVVLQQREIKLREKNFWIGGVTLAALFLGSLFLALLRNGRNKQKAALLHLRQQQEIDLLKAKASAEEEERNRIGRELHDGIVSQLLAIKLNLGAIRDKDTEALNGDALRNLTMQLEEAASDLRTTAHNLMPESLLYQGWESAVDGLCRKTSRNTVMDVDLQIYGAMPALRNDAALSLYRIIQELIQNALKHAQASLLLVQLSCREGLLHITVDDNGIGLPEKVLAEYPMGIGFKNLRRRVAELKGSLDIHSSPGETTIYMEFEEQWLI